MTDKTKSTEAPESPVRVEGDIMRVVCPKCNKPTKVTWNWVLTMQGFWLHECWECENVFETYARVHDDA
jgi:hypothetical protein